MITIIIQQQKHLFAALGASFSSRSYSTGNGNTFMDELTYGVYKSTNGGSSFNRLNIMEMEMEI